MEIDFRNLGRTILLLLTAILYLFFTVVTRHSSNIVITRVEDSLKGIKSTKEKIKLYKNKREVKSRNIYSSVYRMYTTPCLTFL